MRSFEGASYGSLDAFRLVEQDVPAPLAGQVRIRVDATALGFVDGLIVQGRYQIKPPLPYVPGGEIAGVVDAIGAGVRHPSVGSRVVTWQLGGGLSEYLVVAANEVELIPAGLDFASAAAMLVDYQTAHYALFERGRVRAGETVLVVGAAGGVGSAAVQLAAKAGAHVIAAASTAEKRAQPGCVQAALGRFEPQHRPLFRVDIAVAGRMQRLERPLVGVQPLAEEFAISGLECANSQASAAR